MFVRITKYKMKSDAQDSAVDIMNGLKTEIMSLPGMKQFINSMDDDGSGHIISVAESREISDANASRIKDLWANFAHLLESPPTMEGHDVLADWRN